MYKLLIVALTLLPTLANAQGLKCSKGYQPYADRCISQRMADFISCVEASGGNRELMTEEVRKAGAEKNSAGVQASGKGPVVKATAKVSLDRATEKALARRWETRWFEGGMNTCSQILGKPMSKRETRKVVKTAAKEGAKEAVSEVLPQTSGELIPGSKPTPHELPCIADASPTDLILLYGNCASYTDKFPHTVIRVKDQALLAVGKKDNGITISGRFFSRDNRIVAELKDNRFFVNPNNYFRVERPNKHSLIVYDQQGNQALNVEYLNKSAIKILGRFYFPDRPPIIIDENGTKFGGGLISRMCAGYAGGADIMLE